MPDLHGRCLCGGVQFELTEGPDRLRYCHCEFCKKLSGGGGTVNVRMRSAAIRILAGQDLIQTYRSFLDRRRASRPAEEYRQPTDEEWKEFQQHFHARKLELGTCGRPYGWRP